MLSKLVLKLRQKDNDIKFSMNMASAFHGALMECIDREYASALHNNLVNPYSQYINSDGEYIFWNICTTSKESYEKLISPFLGNSFEEILLKYHQTLFQIEEANCMKKSLEDLMKETYFTDSERNITISFLSPTSFKSHGKYCNYPTVKWIIRSLMNKAEMISEKVHVFDEDVLEMMTDDIYISKYNLRSTKFSLEGVKIPAFLGRITLHSNCSQTLTNLLNFLVHVGEYSGCGIKSSIGMGAMKVLS